MRPTPIPDAEIWPGASRIVLSAPDGDLTSTDIAPVEALVECLPDQHSISVRCVPEQDDLELLAAGGTLWLTFFGRAIPPMSLTVLQPQPQHQVPAPDVPGYAGSTGPFPSQYTAPHVYARDVHSGSGNCVCGSSLGHRLHTETAPGVPVPTRMRAP